MAFYNENISELAFVCHLDILYSISIKKRVIVFMSAWSKEIDVTKDGSKRMTKQELHKEKLTNRVIWMADASQVTKS